MEKLAEETCTLILFESPHRIQKTLEEFYSIFGNRKVVIAREITKIYEEVSRTELKHLNAIQDFKKPKGEITLIVEGKPKEKSHEQ